MESNKSTMIVLDDDRATMTQLAQIVGGRHSIRNASTIKEALGWLENDRTVTAMMVDQHLKEKRGLEVLKTAKLVRPEVRRILASRYADLTDIVNGVHSGVINRIVSRPFSASEVLKALAFEVSMHVANSAHSGASAGTTQA